MARDYNILIGCSGCLDVANIVDLLDELNRRKSSIADGACNLSDIKINVRLIVTESANKLMTFQVKAKLKRLGVDDIYDDQREWEKWNKMGDPILHIQLRLWADLLVLAPLSANSLAKLANGICDNLMLCVARVWDRKRPVIFCPAMHPYMRDFPLTTLHIDTLSSFGFTHIEAIVDSDNRDVVYISSAVVPIKKILEKIFEFVRSHVDSQQPVSSVMKPTPPTVQKVTTSPRKLVHSSGSRGCGTSLLLKGASSIPVSRVSHTKTRNKLVQALRAARESESKSPIDPKIDLRSELRDIEAEVYFELESEPELITKVPRKRSQVTEDMVDPNQRKRRRKSNPNGSDDLPPIISRESYQVNSSPIIISGLTTTPKTSIGSNEKTSNSFDSSCSNGNHTDEEIDFDPSHLLEQTMTTDDTMCESSETFNEGTKGDSNFMPILDTKRFLSLCFDRDSQAYKCAICKHEYKNKRAMQRHFRDKHIQDSTLQCRICGIPYKRKIQLLKHEEEKHNRRTLSASLSASDYESEESNIRIEIR